MKYISLETIIPMYSTGYILLSSDLNLLYHHNLSLNASGFFFFWGGGGGEDYHVNICLKTCIAGCNGHVAHLT